MRKKEALKEIEKTKERGNQPDATQEKQEKKAAKRPIDNVRKDMAADVFNKRDKDGGNKMIYKMARDEDDKSKDVKDGTLIKD